MLHKTSTITIHSGEYYYNILEYLSKDYILYTLCGFNKEHRYSVNNFKKILAHIKKTKIDHEIEVNICGNYIELHYILPMKNGRQPSLCSCNHNYYYRDNKSIKHDDCIRLHIYWEESNLTYQQKVNTGGYGYDTNNTLDVFYVHTNKVNRDIFLNELLLMEYLVYVEEQHNIGLDNNPSIYRYNNSDISHRYSDLMKFLKIQAMQ